MAATTTSLPSSCNKEKEPTTVNITTTTAHNGDDNVDNATMTTAATAAQAARVSLLLKLIVETASNRRRRTTPQQQDDDDDDDDDEDEEQRQRNAYLDRLRSYSPLTHFAKPPSLSPLICSLFGWRNVSCNMLKCDECQQALALIYMPTLSVMSSGKLTCFYEDRLSASHKITCSFHGPAASYVELARKKKNSRTTVTATAATTTIVEGSSNAIMDPIVPTLLESLFTKQDLQLMDHINPVHPLINLVTSLHQQSLNILLAPNDDDCNHQQQQQQQQEQELVWQLPKLETPKSFLFYDPSRKSGDSLPNQTLLQRLVDVLVRTRDKDNDDDIIKFTNWIKQQGQSSAYHVESLVALVLLGWRPLPPPPPCEETTVTAATAAAVSGSDSPSSRTCRSRVAVFSVSCPLCLASLSIELVPVARGNSTGSADAISQREQRQHQHQQQMHVPINKNKRRRCNPSPYCNPVTGHKHYCPHITGFPINGASAAKPLWQSIADRLLLLQSQHQLQEGSLLASSSCQNGGEEDVSGEKTTSSSTAGQRQEQPGAWERIHKMLISGIALKKDNNIGLD